MLTVRDNINTDIFSQLPEYFREEGGAIADLLSMYYQWLDIRNPRNIPKIGDIDSSTQDEEFAKYLIFFKEKYLKDFPVKRATNNIDIPFLVKHISDLYQRKGTEEGLRLLFRLVFNEEIEIFFPSTSILRASDSVWSGVSYLEMSPVASYEDYPIAKLDIITGDVSGAKAFVDEVIFVRINGPLIPVVYISNVDGEFTPDDTFTVRKQFSNSFVKTGKIFRGSIQSARVLNRNRVPGQKVGDEIKFVSDDYGLGATGIVTEVATEVTGQINFELIESGYGYVYGTWYNPLSPDYNLPYDPSVYTPPANIENNILISDQVVVINLGEEDSVDVRIGDTITATNAIVTPVNDQVVPTNSPKISFVDGDVDVNDNSIQISSHGLSTGVPVRYVIGDGNTAVPPLDEDTIYYLIRLDDNNIRLATTLQNAIDGIAIDITGTGLTPLVGNTTVRSELQCIISYYSEESESSLDITNAVANGTFDQVTYTTGITSHLYEVGDSINIVNMVPDIFDAQNALIVSKTGTTFTIEKQTDVLDTFISGGQVTKTTKFLTEITGEGTIIDKEGQLVYFKAVVPFPELPDNGKVQVDFVNVAKNPVNNVTIPDVTLTRIAPKNDTAQFDISVTNSETVSLITDIIGDFIDVQLQEDGQPIESSDYGMSGPGAENLNTRLVDAFTIVDVSIGEIEEIFVRSNGFDYENDVKGFVNQPEIANFDKKNLIIEFNTIGFRLDAGDIITQERTVENVRYDGVTGDATVPYTAKAQFIRQEGNKFYFKQLSFYDFDTTLPVKIFEGADVDYFIASLQRDLSTEPMGNNAFVQGDAEFDTGQIRTVSIVNTGFRYENNEIATIYSANDETNSKPLALAQLTVNSNGKSAGSWKTKSSFLSETTRALHDNFYYQEYSYDISSTTPVAEYERLVKDTVAVAGTKLFASSLINTENDALTNLDVEMQIFNITNANYQAEISTETISDTSFNITQIEAIGSVYQYFTASNHGYQVGDVVRVEIVEGQTPTVDSGVLGDVTIFSVTSDTFTVLTGTNVGTSTIYTGTGEIQSSKFVDSGTDLFVTEDTPPDNLVATIITFDSNVQINE